MGSTLIFQFLYINVLNYRYFHTNCSTFFKNKKRWKNKKTLKTCFYRKINVYYNYGFCYYMANYKFSVFKDISKKCGKKEKKA